MNLWSASSYDKILRSDFIEFNFKEISYPVLLIFKLFLCSKHLPNVKSKITNFSHIPNVDPEVIPNDYNNVVRELASTNLHVTSGVIVVMSLLLTHWQTLGAKDTPTHR